jgi:DNA-binding NarL/FixJ family response regulator
VAPDASPCDDSPVPTVLIVDDHRAFRASARRLLELDGFEVVGEAEDGASGAALARELEPEVVLLDVALPDTSGFEVADQLRASPSKVVLVSSRDPADFGSKVAASGAAGFIPKERLTTDAIRALLDEAA